MRNFFSLFLITLFFSSPVLAQSAIKCHCKDTEKTIFNLQIKDKEKILSVCTDENYSFIQYRFGKPGNIELSYPTDMNAASWKQFEYFSVSRNGGAMNAGFGNHELSFKRADVEYVVYDSYAYADDTEESYQEEIGVKVTVNGKVYDIKGDVKTDEGTITNVEDSGKIKNKFWEED